MHVGQGSGCNRGLWDVNLSCWSGQSNFDRVGDVWVIQAKSAVALFKRDCIAAAWGYAIAVALVSNLQQLQMKLGRYCWFIDVQCGRDNLHRNQIVEWKMQCQLLFDKTRHCICWKQVGTTTYCSLECMYVWIWSFCCDIVAFGVVEFICCVAEMQLCNDLDV